MENQEREIRTYETADGKVPFNNWLEKLRDRKGRAIIRNRITRLQLGLFGDTKTVGNGVYELRIDFGPGYRVYYGLDGDTIVLLLLGGDKSTQTKNIKTAINYWSDYESENNGEKS